MQHNAQAKPTHGSLAKGLRLLSAFLPDNKEMGTVELSRLFDMNRSTVSRMLTVLRQQGFVRQNPENKKYSLGDTVTSLSAAYLSSFQSTLTQLAKPFLDQLRSELNQTVVLEIPSGSHTLVTYVTEGLGPIKIAARIGDRHYYHISAGGKCILAYSSQVFIDEVLHSDLPQLTPKTNVDCNALANDLKKIRKSSFAFDGEGNNPGINAFAVPVFDSDGLPVAAVVTAGPSNTVTWKERSLLVEKLQRTAEKICSLHTNEEEASR